MLRAQKNKKVIVQQRHPIEIIHWPVKVDQCLSFRQAGRPVYMAGMLDELTARRRGAGELFTIKEQIVALDTLWYQKSSDRLKNSNTSQ